MKDRNAGDLLRRADAFAELKHRGQYRRDGVTPYVEHPRAVSEILRGEFGVTDVEVLAAGLLHDTIEDTTTDYDAIEERFGARIAGMVALLTKDKRLPEKRREREYFAGLAEASPWTKLCKIADTLHNCRDSNAELRPKAVRKAEVLLRLFRNVPACRGPLAVLQEEIDRWTGSSRPSRRTTRSKGS